MVIDDSSALIQAAAEVMGTTPEEITGREKTAAVAFARQVVMALWCESHSLQKSCELVGRHHHTSSVYARRTIHEKLQYCPATRERMMKILARYREIILAKESTEQ